MPSAMQTALQNSASYQQHFASNGSAGGVGNTSSSHNPYGSNTSTRTSSPITTTSPGPSSYQSMYGIGAAFASSSGDGSSVSQQQQQRQQQSNSNNNSSTEPPFFGAPLARAKSNPDSVRSSSNGSNLYAMGTSGDNSDSEHHLDSIQFQPSFSRGSNSGGSSLPGSFIRDSSSVPRHSNVAAAASHDDWSVLSVAATAPPSGIRRNSYNSGIGGQQQQQYEYQQQQQQLHHHSSNGPVPTSTFNSMTSTGSGSNWMNSLYDSYDGNNGASNNNNNINSSSQQFDQQRSPQFHHSNHHNGSPTNSGYDSFAYPSSAGVSRDAIGGATSPTRPPRHSSSSYDRLGGQYDTGNGTNSGDINFIDRPFQSQQGQQQQQQQQGGVDHQRMFNSSGGNSSSSGNGHAYRPQQQQQQQQQHFFSES
eukprot:15783-Heterococcus_DN1.PRE.1